MGEPATASIRERGEITIPKKIRDSFGLEKGQPLEFIPLGDSAILLAPKRLELEEARRQIRRILKQANVTPEDLLSDMNLSREETFQKHYPKKRRGKRP